MLRHWVLDLFSHPNPAGLLIVAGKTTIVYVFLVVGLRWLGKRELGQMTIYDLVLIIVLANAVQNAMVGDDTSLFGGLVAATTLLLLNWLLTRIMARSPQLERFMVGQPILIVIHGHLLKDRVQRQGLTSDQVMAALREHGLERLDQVSMAVLEVDGTISVVAKDAKVFRTRRHFRALRMP
jgi:uncharacterized membrane protein YcaP (DUF421 family)